MHARAHAHDHTQHLHALHTTQKYAEEPPSTQQRPLIPSQRPLAQPRRSFPTPPVSAVSANDLRSGGQNSGSSRGQARTRDATEILLMPTHWPADSAVLTQASKHVVAAEGSRWDGGDKAGAAEEWEAAAAAAAAGVAVVAPGEWDMNRKRDGEPTEEPRRRQRLGDGWGWLALLHAQKAANAMAESCESPQTGDAAWEHTNVNLLQTQGLDPKAVNGVTVAALQPLGAVSQEQASLRLGHVGAYVGGVKGTEGMQGSLQGLPATGYVGQLGGVLGLGSQQPILPAQQQMQSLALPTPYTFGVIDPIGMAKLPMGSLPLAGLPVPTLSTPMQRSSEAVLHHAAPGLAGGSQQALAAASGQHQASLPDLAASLPLPLSEQVPY